MLVYELSDQQYEELMEKRNSAIKFGKKNIVRRIDCIIYGSISHGGFTARQISYRLDMVEPTIRNIQRKYAKDGISSIENKKVNREVKLSIEQALELKRIRDTTKPPKGRTWSWRKLAALAIELGYCESITYEGVRYVFRRIGLTRSH